MNKFFTSLTFIWCISSVLMISGATIIIGKEKEPNIPQKEPKVEFPEGIVFDCVLLKYNDKGEKNIRTSAAPILKTLDGGRVVTYPDSFVPVLIPKSQVEKCQKAIGKNSVLVISPSIGEKL